MKLDPADNNEFLMRVLTFFPFNDNIKKSCFGEVGRMKNKERAASASLIIHLILTLAVGITEKHLLGGSVKAVSLVFTVVRYLIPIFVYWKLTGFIPFVSPINLSSVEENGESVKITPFLFILALTLSVTALNSVGMLTDLIFSSPDRAAGASVLQSGIAFSFIKTVCVAAITEELLFRGVILNAFSERSGGTRIIISALAFALMHGNIRQFFYAFAAGLVIAYFSVITGSLVFSVLLHFSANLVTFIFAVLKEFISVKIYTRVSLIAFLSFAVIGIICCVSFFIREKGKIKMSAFASEERYPTALAVYLLAAGAVCVISAF